MLCFLQDAVGIGSDLMILLAFSYLPGLGVAADEPDEAIAIALGGYCRYLRLRVCETLEEMFCAFDERVLDWVSKA